MQESTSAAEVTPSAESPKPPEPRGPALTIDRGDGIGVFEMRVVSAVLTTKRLENAALDTDENALQLQVVVRSKDPVRNVLAPAEQVVSVVPSACATSDCMSGYFDNATRFFSESEVDENGQGPGVGGVGPGDPLEAGTDYYSTWEAVLSTDEDLAGAKLCELDFKPTNCIELGEVAKGAGVQ
ncbi:hypothetical protein ACWEKM_26175 [Streptomyces sp. NPDC004752]